MDNPSTKFRPMRVTGEYVTLALRRAYAANPTEGLALAAGTLPTATPAERLAICEGRARLTGTSPAPLHYEEE